MADNVVINPGVGGANIATDDDGTAQYQWVKLKFGADGAFTAVDASNPLPVTAIGGATSAKQPAFSVAGSASADVLTVQGAVGAQAVICNVTTLSPGSSAGSLGKAEDAVHGNGDIGVAVWARRIDTPASSSTASGDYVTFNQSAEGGQWTTPTPSALGGLTIHRLISANTTNATNVKNAAGSLYGYHITNSNAAARYCKFYNKASAPTVGTDTPVLTLYLPPTSATVLPNGAHGIAFSSGLSYALTTGITDADTGAVAADEHAVNLFYK